MAADLRDDEPPEECPGQYCRGKKLDVRSWLFGRPFTLHCKRCSLLFAQGSDSIWRKNGYL